MMKKFLLITFVLLIASQTNFAQDKASKEALYKGKYKNYLIATKYINKGNEHLKKKKYSWALQAYNKSIKYYPLAAAYSNMSIVYRVTGDYKKMFFCLKQAGRLGDKKARYIWRLYKRGY